MRAIKMVATRAAIGYVLLCGSLCERIYFISVFYLLRKLHLRHALHLHALGIKPIQTFLLSNIVAAKCEVAIYCRRGLSRVEAIGFIAAVLFRSLNTSR
uniref:Putative secreted protein n=1 Tax=Anopheles darlingi TaxID=43151 RepID=A0A2M4DKS5_ANODA